MEKSGMEENIAPKTISSSSEAVMPSPASLVDDLRLFQELVKRVADILHILIEEVKECTISSLISSTLLYPQGLPFQVIRPF